MVDHRHHQNFVRIVADHHLRAISFAKQLVLFQRTVEHIDPFGSLAFKFATDDFQLASLLARAHQSGVDDFAFIGLDDLCNALFCLAVNFLVTGRQNRQPCNKQQANPYRCVILYLFLCEHCFQSGFHMMFLSYSDAAVKAFTAKKRRGIPVRFFAFL